VLINVSIYLSTPATKIYDKELCCRRGTARRAVSVETVRNVAGMFVELHSKSLAIGERPSRSFKVTGNGPPPHSPKARSAYIRLSYIFYALSELSCRGRWPLPITLAVTTLLG